ncbi:hypothetical protein AB0I49_29480 [Streptomyces sp. NPDC050617]|uniref:hypothetical protein n=1 Tax=Streptomyces sp. NPDC050617 TaxID=3154628 RepID=UPI0034292B98
MRASWLGYPQVVLACWCPLVAVGLWHLLRRLSVRLPARERFILAMATAVTPLMALAVPYVPHSPLRDALPWRAPMAWGISSGITDVDGRHPLTALTTQLMLAASVAPLVCLVVSFAAGAAKAVRTGRAVAMLAPQRYGDIWITTAPGRAVQDVASTVGLLRPRIILGPQVINSAEASAIIEHERAHARARHPLWIFVATCVLRSWWWIPGRKAVLAELRLTAELWADQYARETEGAAAVAKALCARIEARSRSAHQDVALAGGGTGFLDPGVALTHRAQALARPPQAIPTWQAWTVRAAAVAAVATVALLL